MLTLFYLLFQTITVFHKYLIQSSVGVQVDCDIYKYNNMLVNMSTTEMGWIILFFFIIFSPQECALALFHHIWSCTFLGHQLHPCFAPM